MLYRLSAILLAFAVAGCDKVEVEYAAPASAGDFASAKSQANNGYTYFKLARDYVLVSPAGVKPAAAAGAAAPVGTAASTRQASPEVMMQAGASSATSPKGKTTKPKPTGKAGGSGTADQTNAAPSTPPQPTTLDNPLGSALIDGQVWTAKVVPLPDDGAGLAVRAKSGFFAVTTIGVNFYENTDLVASVSSSAENLVPKRIGQIAGIAATVVSTVLSSGVSTEMIAPLPLQTFSIPIEDHDSNGTINPEWTYNLTFDSASSLDGTISVEQFRAHMNDEVVNFWPVPACRTATLTLTHQYQGQTTYAFHLVVATPEHLRLQPLPVSGSLSLGSVCGASATGTANSDELQNALDDMTALQKAVQQVKDAAKPDSASKSTSAGSSSDTKSQ